MNTNPIFSFQSTSVRVVSDEQGEPWFCAKDVCTVLGYRNDSDTIKKHCREHGVAKRDLIDDLGRKQEAAFINEGNLYRLIVKSRKPEAEAFEQWLMDEVLPTIRKTGQYVATHATKSRQKEIAGGLTAQQQEALRELVKARAEQIDEPRLRAGATIKLWSCLKSHFHLGEKETYRNIPSTQFTEALSVVSRQALEGLAEQQRHDARLPLLSGPAGTRMLVSLELNGRYNVMPLSPTDCVVDIAELVALDAAMDGWRKFSRRYELDARRVFSQPQ